MKKRKNLVALTLCLTASLMMLSGCGGQQGSSPASQQGQEGETEWNGKVITLQPAS